MAAPLLVILVTLSTCLAKGSDGSPPKNKPVAEQSQDTSPTPSPSTSPSTSASAPVPVLPPLSLSPSTSPTPAGPAACADKDLDLTASMEKTTYAVGARPRFKLTVTSKSTGPCVRDVGAGQQELSVNQEARKLWSSDHCSPNSKADIRTLFPGEKRTYWLDWSGRSSEPGCPKTRAEVGPGSYQLVARLGSLVSKPLGFTITK